MGARITANLLSRDLDATLAFWGRLGFAARMRDDGWMILGRGPFEVEFVPCPGLDPAASLASACLRTDDLDGLLAEWGALGLPRRGIPRLSPVEPAPPGLRVAALVDPDGNLLRLIAPA